MLKIPVNSRMLKALLCVSLIIDITVSVFILSGANQGYCSGIQGKVTVRQPLYSDDYQGSSIEKPCPNVVLYVRDTATQKVITKVTCDDEGYFKIHLVPGKYSLEVAPGGDDLQMAGEPASVELVEGEFENVAVRVERTQGKYSQLPYLHI